MSHRPAGYVLPWIPTTDLVGSAIPPNCRYYITMFGGGSDAQSVACPYSTLARTYGPGIPRTSSGAAYADGTWWYIADAIRGGMGRFPCGSKVRLTNPDNGVSCVVIVADMGPGRIAQGSIERLAGGPVIDASPLAVNYLFGRDSFGYADHKEVIATPVDPSTPVGPADTVNPNLACIGGAASGSIGSALAAVFLIGLGGWALWQYEKEARIFTKKGRR